MLKISGLMIAALAMGVLVGCGPAPTQVAQQPPTTPSEPPQLVAGAAGGSAPAAQPTPPTSGEEPQTTETEDTTPDEPPATPATPAPAPPAPSPPPVSSNPFPPLAQGAAGGAGGQLVGESTSPAVPEQPAAPAAGDPAAPAAPASGEQPAAPAEAAAPTFYEQALRAFAEGNEVAAFQYLYLNALTDPSYFNQFPLEWYEGLREPRIALRWGIGIVYSAPAAFGGDPPVIGREDAGGGDAGMNLGGGAMGQGLAPPTSGPPRQRAAAAPATASGDPQEDLEKFTGDVGKFLLRRLDGRRTHQDAFYGRLLQSIKQSDIVAAGQAAGQTPGTPEGQGANQGNDGTSIGQTRRVLTSPFGSAAAPPTFFESAAVRNSLQPGVAMLGVDSEGVLMSRANQIGIDLAIIIEVEVRTGRNDSASSTTRLKIMDAKKNQQVFRLPRGLISTAVQTARQRGGTSDDPVELALDEMFQGFADQQYKAAPMPELSPEIANKRADYLAQQQHTNPLPAVIEIAFYHHKGWISSGDFANAVQQIIGERNAQMLIDGPPEAKKEALSNWMPERMKVDDGRTGAGFR